jgi:tyrosyl-tRNA synthetase
MTKMLVGLDGRKMSTSWGNVINIGDEANEQFGKIMSVRDELIPEYFETTTGLSGKEVEEIKKELKKAKNPKSLKERLGFEVVKRYHGEKAAREAREHFQTLFTKREMPADLPELTLKNSKMSALDIVLASGAVKSKSEARRLIEQGGFEFREEAVKDPQKMLQSTGVEIVRIGKHRFFRLKI